MAALTDVKVIDMVGGEVSKISYNGEEYAKVSEREDEIHANSGDILLRVNCAEDYARIGDYFAVNSDRRIVDREDDEIRPHLKHYAIFEKVLAESDDKLAELESRIAALEATQPFAQQAPTEPQYRKVTDRSPKVGDYVKYDEAPESYLTDGKYYEITDIDSCNDPQIIDDEGDGYDTDNCPDFEVYEKVSDSQPQEPTLKVGDYAKVTRADQFEIDEIVEIIGEDSEHFETRHFRAKSLQRNYWHYADKEGELVPATDEEVAEAKRAAKFAEIGRKPGEFKAGDIVEVVDGCGGHKDGTIGECDGHSHGRHVYVKANGMRYSGSAKLITPVERRFDR